MTAAGGASPPRVPSRGHRSLLALAAVSVAFTAADTYVVVLALPDMMSGVGLSIDELQRAAPIVSGFLLGYVAMLPLIGRVADLRGRLPVLTGSLVAFAAGSLVTAASYDLTSMVAGRFLQGVGAGGLVPATLALVADLYPPARRGVPLGLVGAVQELGSVLGPLYGAAVLAAAGWEQIFWINLGVALLLAAGLRAAGPRTAAGPATAAATDGGGIRPARAGLPGIALALLAAGCLALVMVAPEGLTSRVTLGLAFVPVAGGSRWLSPLALVVFVLLAGLVAHGWWARRPVVNLRGWTAVTEQADLVAGGLLALCLGGVILTFATADPEVRLLSPAGPWLLTGSATAGVAFWWRNRRAAHPLVPPGLLARTPAWGALVASFFVGSALIAALVDIPVFARLTVYPDSQLSAALVLLRFLVALPVGAMLGGWLVHRAPAGVVAAAGTVLAAVGFLWMAQWGSDSLGQAVSTVPLVLTGLGFGIALAPVNAALLAATESAVHGVASALLVVARMVGMLVGVSALTAIGLRRYYAAQADLPPPGRVCPSGTSCPEYTDLLREAGLTQLHTIFAGAALCAVAAAVVVAITFRSVPTRAPAVQRIS